MDSFTVKELAEMYGYLEYMTNNYDGFCYTYLKSNDACDIVYDYIRHLLFSAIGEGSYNSRRELFDVVMAM